MAVSGWVGEHNVGQLLELAAAWVQYELDDLDWDPIVAHTVSP